MSRVSVTPGVAGEALSLGAAPAAPRTPVTASAAGMTNRFMERRYQRRRAGKGAAASGEAAARDRQEVSARSSTPSGWGAIIGPSPDGSAMPSSTHVKRPSSTACAAA